mmetsp:Transcript_60168/g.141649  ORF Transcript_60168/g.141649 Transcript_60168/m.141649 type:complete len:535 (-) Transcript_60168:138-1742(-)
MVSRGALGVPGLLLTLVLASAIPPEAPAQPAVKVEYLDGASGSSFASTSQLGLSSEWAAFEGLKKQQRENDLEAAQAARLRRAAAPPHAIMGTDKQAPKAAKRVHKQAPNAVHVPEQASHDQAPKAAMRVHDQSQQTATHVHKQAPKAATHVQKAAAAPQVAAPQAAAPAAAPQLGSGQARRAAASHAALHKEQNDQISAHAARVSSAPLTDQWLKYEGLSTKAAGKSAHITLGAQPQLTDSNETAPESDGHFDAREAAATLQEYVDSHPGFAASAATWLGVGFLLFGVSVLVLLFSEIRVVLVVRDQDFRNQMLREGNMRETQNLEKLEQKEADSQAARPYVTGACMILLFIAIVCILKPFCNVLDIIGLPSSNCFLTVGFGGFVGSVVVTTFIMGMCWSCTRGWAAFVLLLISISGSLFCPTGIPFLVVLWILLSLGLFIYYFIYLPETDDCPEWCQSIGPLKASMNPEDWKRDFSSSANASFEDIRALASNITGSGSKESEASSMSSPAANTPGAEGKDGKIDKKRNTTSV